MIRYQDALSLLENDDAEYITRTTGTLGAPTDRDARMMLLGRYRSLVALMLTCEVTPSRLLHELQGADRARRLVSAVRSEPVSEGMVERCVGLAVGGSIVERVR